MKRLIGCALACLLSVATAGTAHSQEYPSRPVRVIIPFGPGGGMDVLFRILSPKLSESLGRPIVIENRPGASGVIGNNVVAKAAPDGYTLGVTNISMGVNPFVMSQLPYDTEQDFTPISLVATITQILLVHPTMPVRSVKELIAFAKAKPGVVNFASGGNASSGHLAGELFMFKTGVKMTHIPYKGGGPSVAASLSGETPVNFTTVAAAIQHIQSGKLIGLGVSSLTRDPALPEIPSIAEAGVPGYEFLDWYGLVGPAKMPGTVINRLHQEIVKVLADPELKKRIEKIGVTAVGTTPDAFGGVIKKELATWSTLAKATGLRIE